MHKLCIALAKVISPKELYSIIVDKNKKYINYIKNIAYNEIFNEFKVPLIYFII